MQFVILFGQGRFLSRHVHQVILNIIDRAMAAFSATGMDPDRYFFHHFISYQFILLVCSLEVLERAQRSIAKGAVLLARAPPFEPKLTCSVDVCRVLPSDDWFIDVAQETISRISGKPRVANGEREVNSPTASVSAQSVSSARSHSSS